MKPSIAVIVLSTLGALPLRAKPPLDDAFALWHLGDEKGAGAEARGLKVEGAVKLGVALKGKDGEESRRRGGDGKAAVFEGGHLALDGDGLLNLPGQAFTIALRVKDPEGRWEHPLFGSNGGKGKLSYSLRAVNGATLPMNDRHIEKEIPTIYRWLFGTPDGPRAVLGSQSFLEFTWGAAKPNGPRVQKLAKAPDKNFSLHEDVTNGLMHVGFPAQRLGLTDWHDVIVRFTGPKLQLFIDGVLMDEEFPIGETRQNRVACLIGAVMGEDGQVAGGFRGQMDHVAVWKRALSDDEVTELSGGAAVVAKRDVEILGPQAERMQYFRPRGYNAKAGDCIPFWHEGTFHLFYLQLRRNRHSKWDWGHGALEIHHASTRDLVTWQHHPVAVPVSEQWEAWNGTGGLAFHEGKFHLFHPCPSYDKEWPFTGIQYVTSTDGIHFTKEQPHPFMEGGDCEIYHEEATGLFHLLKSGDAKRGTKKLIRLVSSDLREWKEAPEPFMEVEEKYGVRTCPHLFGWKGRFYFMGGNTTWSSDKQFGPWALHSPVRLEQLSVPKTAAFPGGRRIMAGFLIDGTWGGNLILRDLVQMADGSLGSKFVPEMVPAAGEPLAFVIQQAGADMKGQGSVTLTGGAKEAEAFVEKIPQNVRISMMVTPGSAKGVFGIGLRGRDSAEASCRLEFDMAKKLVSWKTMTDSALRRSTGPRAEDVELLLKPVRLDIIAHDDLVDVEIDGCRTLVNRYWDAKGDRLYLWAKKEGVTFQDVQIRPLTADKSVP